jgi:IS4 transposase
LPDDAVERARRRLRRELGSVSAQVMEAAKFVLLFTTATRGRLDAERCLQAYRLRWQIELTSATTPPWPGSTLSSAA